MITILIADDEHHVCTYITDLLQSQNWDLDIHTAYSGTEALEAIDHHVFHLALLDIDMPGATGLEVAREISERYPRTRVLFLTAYDNFDYIYSAMAMKCKGYILKLEPDHVILDQIGKIVEEIWEEQRNMAQIDEIHRKDQMLTFLSQQTLLQHICYHGNPELIQREARRLSAEHSLQPDQPFYLMYTSYSEEQPNATDASIFQNASLQIDSNFLLQRITLMNSLLCGKLSCHVFHCEDHALLYFFQALEDTSPLANIIFLRHVADEFISTLSAASDIYHEIAVLLTESLSCTSISTIFPVLKAYGDSAIPANASCVIFADKKSLDRFSKNQSAKSKPAKNEQILKLIQAYVVQNYNSKLTLSTIAALVNYNESYISRLFKKETGQGVVEYITSVRLEKSKELLTGTNTSIQDIASAVGFDTAQYFSSIFRKQEGMSPTEYRLFQKKPQ